MPRYYITHDIKNKSLLLSNDVALQLECSAQSVREWARSGKLPYIETVRGVRLFREEDVRIFAEKRALKGETE